MEPLLKYKKGEGWVYETEDYREFDWSDDSFKYRVKLIDKFPETGEHYYAIATTYRKTDGMYDWQQVWNALSPDMRFRPLDMGGVYSGEKLSWHKGATFVVIEVERTMFNGRTLP